MSLKAPAAATPERHALAVTSASCELLQGGDLGGDAVAGGLQVRVLQELCGRRTLRRVPGRHGVQDGQQHATDVRGQLVGRQRRLAQD